jgi:hypothetical protein
MSKLVLRRCEIKIRCTLEMAPGLVVTRTPRGYKRNEKVLGDGSGGELP